MILVAFLQIQQLWQPISRRLLPHFTPCCPIWSPYKQRASHQHFRSDRQCIKLVLVLTLIRKKKPEPVLLIHNHGNKVLYWNSSSTEVVSGNGKTSRLTCRRISVLITDSQYIALFSHLVIVKSLLEYLRKMTLVRRCMAQTAT